MRTVVSGVGSGSTADGKDNWCIEDLRLVVCRGDKALDGGASALWSGGRGGGKI